MNDAKLPPDIVSNLLVAGYGQMEVAPATREGGPTFGHFFISLADMEKMGEAERVRLGVQMFYEFAMSHQPPSPSGSPLTPDANCL